MRGLSLFIDAKPKLVLERESFYGTGLLSNCRHLECGSWSASMSDVHSRGDTSIFSSSLTLAREMASIVSGIQGGSIRIRKILGVSLRG